MISALPSQPQTTFRSAQVSRLMLSTTGPRASFSGKKHLSSCENWPLLAAEVRKRRERLGGGNALGYCCDEQMRVLLVGLDSGRPAGAARSEWAQAQATVPAPRLQ